MASIEELAEGPRIEIEMLRIADIELDPTNPNELDDAMYEALTREIRDQGFTQPVVVWVKPEGDGQPYRMIDGEHRMRVLADLGAEVVPAVIDKASETEDQARLRLLTMNRLRGQFVPIKLALLLKDLSTRIPEKELRKRLGYEPGEFKDTLRLADFTDPVGDRLRVAVEKERKEAPVVLKFICNARDAAAIEKAVDALVEGKVDRGQALARICRTFKK